MAKDAAQPRSLDGVDRWLFYAIDHYHCTPRSACRSSGAICEGRLLEHALAKLLGVDGDILPAARRYPFYKPYRADRVQEQYLEAASHTPAIVHDDLPCKAQRDPFA